MKQDKSLKLECYLCKKEVVVSKEENDLSIKIAMKTFEGYLDEEFGIVCSNCMKD